MLLSTTYTGRLDLIGCRNELKLQRYFFHDSVWACIWLRWVKIAEISSPKFELTFSWVEEENKLNSCLTILSNVDSYDELEV